MSERRATKHALHRTSPKGGQFVGTCTQCGKEGLTLASMSEECPNIRGVTQEQSLIEAICPET